jgi:hypothetical protein
MESVSDCIFGFTMAIFACDDVKFTVLGSDSFMRIKVF